MLTVPPYHRLRSFDDVTAEVTGLLPFSVHFRCVTQTTVDVTHRCNQKMAHQQGSCEKLLWRIVRKLVPLDTDLYSISRAAVGADEGRVLQREIGVVVPGEDNDAILLAWKLGDYVVH